MSRFKVSSDLVTERRIPRSKTVIFDLGAKDRQVKSAFVLDFALLSYSNADKPVFVVLPHEYGSHVRGKR